MIARPELSRGVHGLLQLCCTKIMPGNSHLGGYGEHPRRSRGKIRAPVTFNNEIKPTQKKYSFFSNAVNVSGEYLQLSGCKVLHATDYDDDLPIVKSNLQNI